MVEKELKNVTEEAIKTSSNEYDVDIKKSAYIGFRYLEGICIAIFIFGMLWEGSEILKLTLPQFLIVYGGAGAVISEFMARFTLGRIKKKTKVKEI